MAISKFPLVRYKVLDRCFRNSYKKYYIETLVEECNKALEEITGVGESVKLRQVRDDIAFMRSPEGWNIELAELFDGKKRIYRYENTRFSIMNLPLNTRLIEEFRSSVEVLSQFEGMPQFDWLQETLTKMNFETHNKQKPIISFDNNPFLKGIEHLSALYKAIKYEKVLNILYQDFNATEPYLFIIHPYFLKQYNNRWFLFGLNSANNKPDWNLAIDRILQIEDSSTEYIPNHSIDWSEYFEDVIGVTKPTDKDAEMVIIHFYGKTGKYFENKPIHGSQKTKWIDENTLEVRLNIIINYELERLILSYADSVKVIQPLSLAFIIKERLEQGFIKY